MTDNHQFDSSYFFYHPTEPTRYPQNNRNEELSLIDLLLSNTKLHVSDLKDCPFSIMYSTNEEKYSHIYSSVYWMNIESWIISNISFVWIIILPIKSSNIENIVKTFSDIPIALANYKETYYRGS